MVYILLCGVRGNDRDWVLVAERDEFVGDVDDFNVDGIIVELVMEWMSWF